jgi:acylphosphatase
MTDAGIVRSIVRVTGRVQGVSFRAAARREARLLGLAGWVRNDEDGSVVIDVEGEPEAMTAFLRWCAQGPPAARVVAVEETRVEPTEHEDFKIQ